MHLQLVENKNLLATRIIILLPNLDTKVVISLIAGLLSVTRVVEHG
jgi:hypothetical protein